MKGCKRRGTFGWLLWRHVSLSLRDESTHSFLSRQKTRTFRQHVSFLHLPYLTQQCFCLPLFVPGLTLLYPTLLRGWRTAETHCTVLWSFTREPACAFLPKENTQELQILCICTILSVTSKKITLCKPWKPASFQFLMGSTVHKGLWANFDQHLVISKGMERSGPGTHLRLCVCYLEAFTSANASMEHIAVSSTKKPWSLTGKLLAKWALPGHGTNCCPLHFKNLKVSQYSEANWLEIYLLAEEPSYDCCLSLLLEPPNSCPWDEVFGKYKSFCEAMSSDSRFIWNKRMYICGDPSTSGLSYRWQTDRS